MALCDATIGLGAQEANMTNQLFDLYVQIDEQLLQQRKYQQEVGSKGALASSTFSYNSISQQADIARQEGNGLIANGSLMIGFQAGGAAYGERLNGQMEEAQTKANNCNDAIGILEQNKPMEPMLGREDEAPNSPFSKYENEEGFKFGDRLSQDDREGLASADNDASRRNALEKAKESKKGFEKEVESVNTRKSEYLNRANQLGQALGSLAQGTAKALEQSLYMAQATYESAKVGSDYLNNTANSLTQTLDGIYSNTYGHFTTLLQTEDALFQADSMRG